MKDNENDSAPSVPMTLGLNHVCYAVLPSASSVTTRPSKQAWWLSLLRPLMLLNEALSLSPSIVRSLSSFWLVICRLGVRRLAALRR